MAFAGIKSMKGVLMKSLKSLSLRAIPLVMAILALPTLASGMTKSEFHDAMRKLWEDHVTYTRLYIVSAVGNLPDKEATTNRLLQNQADIGNAVADFYGKEAGDKLTGLLKEHITTAAEIAEAAKAGDTAKAGDAKTRWYANADQISAFLHAANSKNWPLETLKGAMKTHLDQTAQELTHQLGGDYVASIQDYDAIVQHILMMADVLSDGIEKQFPGKFSGTGKMPAKHPAS